MVCCTILTLLLFIAAAAALSPALAQDDSQSCPAGTDPMALKPGQFVWTPQIAPQGPVTIIISLPQQRAFVFRNGVQIGVSAISTGRPGYDTPTGVFRVLEKDVDHRSNLYDDAPMPYMLRLTWGGVALHAGRDPGVPASHGCIRLPLVFAKSLFGVVPLGAQVIITDRALDPGLRVDPAMFDGSRAGDLPSAEADYWSPERSPTGQLTLLISGADKALSVMRGGVEIGRTGVVITGDEPLHTHALMLMESHTASALSLGAWMLIGLPGDAALPPERHSNHDIDRVRMPPVFARQLGTILKPGTTMVISDLPLGVAASTEISVFGGQ